MSVVEDVDLSSESTRQLSFDVTTGRVVATIATLQLAVLVAVGVEWMGVELPIVRAGLAFLYLTFVPGYLLYRLLGAKTNRVSESLVYVVGLGLASLMLFGVTVNFGLRAVGVSQPLTELPVVISISALVLLLTGAYYRQVEESWTVDIDVGELTSPLVLGLALLPLLGIYGALILTRFSNNWLLLVLYATLAIVPILALRGIIPERLFAFALWITAISLLLQNTLTGQYLAWGDQPKEAALALDVLRQGYWLPAQAPAFGAKYSMLRIVILHPIHALFTDLQLVWVFKLVHPLLFSLTPVALYRAYGNYVDADTAFLSAYLFMSLFSFFIVLSRNTRTASAIFFLSLVALLIAEDSLEQHRKKFLALVFVSAIVVSHYGVSYMVLFALLALYPLTRVIARITGQEARNVTSISFVGVYLSVTFAWYIFASPGAKSFGLVVGFAQTFTDTLVSTFLTSPGSTSATTRYLTSDFRSVTLDVIRLYNVGIGAIIVLGVTLAVWHLVRERNATDFSPEYLSYSMVFLAMFAVTFLPVERFNTARTYPTTLLFFAPFFVIGVREALTLGGRVTAIETKSIKRVATVVVLGYFLLNVGFISATVTNEYSTNALVEKDRIMDDGHPVEKTYFYKQYPTEYDVESTAWMRSHAVNNSTRYESGWPGIPRGAVGYASFDHPDQRTPYIRKQTINSELLDGNNQFGPGYVYLAAYSHIGDVIRLPSGHFEFLYVRTSEARPHWQHKSRVYTNGGSSIYY